MVRHIVFVCSIFAFGFYSAECSAIPKTLNTKIEVKIVENLAVFLEANPGITVQPMIQEEVFDEISNKVQITHRIGSRVNNDHVLATESDTKQWSSLQDVRFQFNYPKSGDSAYIISYFEVVVDQSSHLGQAWVIAGGVGLRHISVIVEAKQTLFFNYKATVYGY